MNEVSTPATPAVAQSSLGEYYSAFQLRIDRWSSLKQVTQYLAAETSENARAKYKGEAQQILSSLQPIEMYWAFPGHAHFHKLHWLLDEANYADLAAIVSRIVGALLSNRYRRKHINLADGAGRPEDDDEAPERAEERVRRRPYFEVLFVNELTESNEAALRAALAELKRAEDNFVYEAVVVPSLEDALIGVLFNHNIQSVVVQHGLRLRSRHQMPILQRHLARIGNESLDDLAPNDYGPQLCRLIHKVRPELDVFLVTNQSVEEIAGRDLGACRRVFYNQEDYMELHLNILRGVGARFETPFFTALKHYSRQPTGVFHAMPISRGKSITKSHWIQDMGEFYGMNIFLAETSATSGGLDSLLDPHGPIKRSQEMAARAFGSKHTFFATNGTSTCNKIVVQALVRPGDIVLVDRDCHKSHHYGMVLAGAQVVYLDSYPLTQYSMYGAVPRRQRGPLRRARKARRRRDGHRVRRGRGRWGRPRAWAAAGRPPPGWWSRTPPSPVGGRTRRFGADRGRTRKGSRLALP